MSLPEPLAYLCQWLEFLAVLVFAGNAIFRRFVFAHALQRPFLSLQEGANLREAARRFDVRLYGAVLVVLTMAMPLDLFLRAAQFMEDNDRLSMLTVVTQTHIGRIWLFKMAALVPGWAGFILHRVDGSSRLNRVLLPATAGLWILALSLSGHTADEEILSLAMAADILHVAAASAWIGGLFPLVQTLRLVSCRLNGETARPVFAAILERFSTMATVSVGGILVSGIYMAWLRLPAAPSLPDNAYGHALLLKLGLVAVIIALGGLNKLYMLPRLKLSATEEMQGVEKVGESLHRRTLIFLAAEASLAMAVLGCAALLAQSSADM